MSQLPPGIQPQALRHVPIPILCAQPAFCFILVDDSATIETYHEILEGWGFRIAEDIVVYDGSLTGSRTPESMQIHRDREGDGKHGSPGYSDCYETRFGDLSGTEVLLDLGLDPADYGSMIPHERHETDCRYSRVFKMQQQPRCRHFTGSPLSASVPEAFRRTARHCLMGIRGAVRR